MDRAAALPPDSWERTPPEAQAYIRMLEARVETLTAMVHAFQEQVGTLQGQLHQTLHSSHSPSSEPSQTQHPRRPRSKRRRGGQPGHPGHTGTLVPVDEVDEVVIIKPAQCMHCHAPLSGDDPKPWRHQVREIPPIEPMVTEYHWHQVQCATCGEVTRAPWPAGVRCTKVLWQPSYARALYAECEYLHGGPRDHGGIQPHRDTDPGATPAGAAVPPVAPVPVGRLPAPDAGMNRSLAACHLRPGVRPSA
jgi:transposase